jgi:inner membrane protein
MLILAHAGITLGAAALVAGVVKGREAVGTEKETWFTALSRYLDIRVLIIGSLLPDIIDKPVGMYLFRDTFHNGRIFSHTLLFFLVLAVAGIILYRSRRITWMLALAAGVLVHLVLDEMWRRPATLLWPFVSGGFGQVEITDIYYYLKILLSSPKILVSEIVGLGILMWLGIDIIVQKKVGLFIRYGKIE